jgi:hypothetical protein
MTKLEQGKLFKWQKTATESAIEAFVDAIILECDAEDDFCDFDDEDDEDDEDEYLDETSFDCFLK